MMPEVTSSPATHRRPMVSEDEIQALAARFGPPARRSYALPADETLFRYRRSPNSDRRAEVVFAIQNPTDLVWLHAKAHYPSHIFRLLSGGIHWDEGVEEALFREIEEETNLTCRVERFLGVLTYHFLFADEVAQFVSYVFTLRTDFAQPVCVRDNEISAFRAVLPSQLLDVSNDLRNLIGDRRHWGLWRALAVDLVHEQLTRGQDQALGRP